MGAVSTKLRDKNLTGDNFINIYDGTINNGIANGDIKLSDGTTVQAFNDFFSANYVKNLECSNVNTLLSGDRIENCFSRTEFEALLDNKKIHTINGIDKNVFYDIYCAAPSGKEVSYVCDAIKASEISVLKDIYYCGEGNAVKIVGRETEGAVNLIDTLLANNNIVSPSSNSIDDILGALGDTLPVESRDALKNLSRNSDRELAQILLHNSDDILDISGRKSLDLGKYSIETGGKITETLADGTRIRVDVPGINSVEDAIANGCRVIDGPEGTYFAISKNKIFKLADSADNIMLVIEIGEELHNTWEEYKRGNYKTGCKEFMSYMATTLGSMAGSSLFTAVVGGIGLAVGATIGAPVMIFAGVVGGIVGSIIGENVGDFIGDVICDLFGYEDANYGNASTVIRYDPLVIDLDGDGFELLSVKDGVYFDEDARGLVEKTEWVAADDALLAIDLNGDGIINDGSELFGTSTTLADGSKAESGFEALAQYDLNGDGVIDENDEVFDKLKVWQDKNGDGISQEDELYSLGELGIDNISLSTSVEDGRLTANINYKNGTTIKIGEFHFDSESYNTVEKNKVVISEEIAELPNIHSIGSIASLHTLMQLDGTGTLKGYVEQFVKSSSRQEKEELVTKILYFVTGAEHVATGNRGSSFDAQKLTVIEQFMGRDFVGTGGRNPVNTAAPILKGIYADIYNAYYSMLNAQTQLADYMGMVFWTEDENGGRYLNTDVFNAFVSVCVEKGNDMSEVVAEMGRYVASINVSNKKNFIDYFTGYINKPDYIKVIADTYVVNSYLGTEENDTLSGTVSMDVLFGGAGNDILRGNNGNDFLFGENGNDSLYGEDGDDILIGGTGNDRLEGGYGNDTYIFNIGDGNDTIYDYEYSQTGGKNDRIVFGAGIHSRNNSYGRTSSNRYYCG